MALRGQSAVERVPPRARKAASLLRLAARNPLEFYDRVRAICEVRAQRLRPTPARYAPVTWEEAAQRLNVIAPDVSWQREHMELQAACRDLEARGRMVGPVPFPSDFDADPVLARLAYFLTRALSPEVVVETGVGLGVVSSCILAALERNGRGRLISIDLPPLGVAPRFVGAVIPDRLRPRWTLVLGSSGRRLGATLAGLPPVGLFVHDSLFTRRNAVEEYRLVLPHLARPSAIVADAVHHSDAFAWLVDQHRPSVSAVVEAEEKPKVLVGVAVYLPRPSDSCHA